MAVTSRTSGLGAGVVPAQTQLASVPYIQQRGPAAYAFNGLRYQENRLLLDGIGSNDNHNGLGVVIFPPIDAVQEFSEETTDADARYGRGSAAPSTWFTSRNRQVSRRVI